MFPCKLAGSRAGHEEGSSRGSPSPGLRGAAPPGRRAWLSLRLAELWLAARGRPASAGVGRPGSACAGGLGPRGRGRRRPGLRPWPFGAAAQYPGAAPRGALWQLPVKRSRRMAILLAYGAPGSASAPSVRSCDAKQHGEVHSPRESRCALQAAVMRARHTR